MTQYNTEYIIESQKKLVWNRFKKHKVAYISLIILIFLYLIALFADFIAPYKATKCSASSGNLVIALSPKATAGY